ncbi:hypothetical protein WDU94_000359, partial [Cyamophila willieti]
EPFGSTAHVDTLADTNFSSEEDYLKAPGHAYYQTKSVYDARIDRVDSTEQDFIKSDHVGALNTKLPQKIRIEEALSTNLPEHIQADEELTVNTDNLHAYKHDKVREKSQDVHRHLDKTQLPKYSSNENDQDDEQETNEINRHERIVQRSFNDNLEHAFNERHGGDKESLHLYDENIEGISKGHERHLEDLSEDGIEAAKIHGIHRRDLQDINDNSLNDLLNGDDVSSVTNRLNSEHSRQILSNNYYERISPTRTTDDVIDQQNLKASHHVSGSGEGRRVLSKGRSLSTRPKNLNFDGEKASPSTGHGSGRDESGGEGGEVTPRSGGNAGNNKNPDFQDILTGFVKLLNGQGGGRPGMPQRSRINNRGPPRITDVPPIIFDPPGQGQVPLPSSPSPVPFIPLHTSSDFPYTFEPPSSEVVYSSGSSQLHDQIQPTKPISQSSSSVDSNVNIFNQRPSIQYLNPSKLPTLPDDLRPPTPPNPIHKPEGKPDNHHHHHQKPHSTTSQRPNVRPESNGYRPDFIEPTKQSAKDPSKLNFNGNNFPMKDPSSNNFPTKDSGNIPNKDNSNFNNNFPSKDSSNFPIKDNNFPTKNNFPSKGVPNKHESYDSIGNSHDGKPSIEPPQLPVREIFGSIFDETKIPDGPAQGSSQGSSQAGENQLPIEGNQIPIETKPLHVQTDNGNDKPGQTNHGVIDETHEDNTHVNKNVTETELVDNKNEVKDPVPSTDTRPIINTLSPVYKPDKPILPLDALLHKPTKDQKDSDSKIQKEDGQKPHKDENNFKRPSKDEIVKDSKRPLKEDVKPHRESIPGILIEPTPSTGSGIPNIQPTSKPNLAPTPGPGPDYELGQGIASVIEGLLEPSLVDTEVKPTRQPTPPVKRPPPGGGYYPRPGIVLDDTDYKPGGHRRPVHPPPIITTGPGHPAIITAGPPSRVQGDIFDVTVSAIQGPGGDEGNETKTGQAFVYPVELEGANGDVITSAQNGQNFVSIDGKRTYLNLFGNNGPSSAPGLPAVKPTPAGGYGSVSHQTGAPSGIGNSVPTSSGNGGSSSTGVGGSRVPWRKPTHPPVRIDTCIVGDDTTCDVAQHERCRTEAGVSSCHCRPGYSRRKHREPCHRIVSIGMSLRVDKMFDQRLTWSEKYKDADSEEYQHLEFEA